MEKHKKNLAKSAKFKFINYAVNGLKNNSKKQKANSNNIKIEVIINIVITECTTSFLVSGFLPTASATLPPSIPTPIPRPKNANPIIIPIQIAVAASTVSI